MKFLLSCYNLLQEKIICDNILLERQVKGGYFMKSKILGELNRIANRMTSQVADVTTARRERKSENPIFREIEADRIHSNYIRIIPATVVLLVVEICGMIWAIWTNVKFDYGKGFLWSCGIFAFISICIIIAIEVDLRRSFISNNKRE